MDFNKLSGSVAGFGKNLQYVSCPHCTPPCHQTWRFMTKRAPTDAHARSSFTPFANRTEQFFREQIGQNVEKARWRPSTHASKTNLTIIRDRTSSRLCRAREAGRRPQGCAPEDAERHVRLSISRPPSAAPLTSPRSSQYTNEAYDYPPNLRESFNDLGRTISEKVNLLSHATSPSEASAAFTAPPSAKPQPKTFSHAVARASLASSQALHQSNTSSASAKDDPLATALEKYAIASEKLGEARLAQDAQIQSRFLAGWSTTLNTNLNFATRARKNVENARLALDGAKGHAKAGQETEAVRQEIEKKEDEFVAQTEEAEGVMKNVRLLPLFLASSTPALLR